MPPVVSWALHAREHTRCLGCSLLLVLSFLRMAKARHMGGRAVYWWAQVTCSSLWDRPGLAPLPSIHAGPPLWETPMPVLAQQVERNALYN